MSDDLPKEIATGAVIRLNVKSDESTKKKKGVYQKWPKLEKKAGSKCSYPFLETPPDPIHHCLFHTLGKYKPWDQECDNPVTWLDVSMYMYGLKVENGKNIIKKPPAHNILRDHFYQICKKMKQRSNELPTLTGVDDLSDNTWITTVEDICDHYNEYLEERLEKRLEKNVK